MPTTPTYAFPYPALSDPPNGPSQIQALATAVENKIVTMDAAVAGVPTIQTDVNNLKTYPYAHLRQTSAQSIPHAAFTAIQFNAEDSDSAGGHDNVTNNTRYTSQRTGRYQISGAIGWVNSATGFRATQWWKNGAVVTGSQLSFVPITGAETQVSARTMIVQLNSGDFIELRGYQESGGGALNTSVLGDTQSSMSVEFVGV